MTAHQADARSPAPRRRWFALLGALLALLALVVLGAWLARKPLAEWLLVRYADGQGFAPASLTVERIGFSGAVLRGIRLGPGGAIRAQSAHLTYRIGELRDGWFDAVVIEGLEASISADEHGIVLNGAATEDPPASTDPSAVPLVPVRHLILKDAVIVAETPVGATRTALSGEVSSARDGALTLDLTFDGAGDQGVIGGTLMASRAVGGMITGRIGLARGEIELAQGSLAGLTGDVVYEGTLDRVDLLRADLSYARLDVAPTPLDAGRVTFELTEERLAGHADLNWPGGHAVLRVSGDPRALPLALSFDAKGNVEAPFLAEYLPFEAAGALGFDIAGAVADVSRLTELPDVPPDQWLGLGTLDGNLDLDLKDVTLPGIGAADALQGLIRVISLGDAVLLEVPSGLTVDRLTLDRARLAALPDELRHMLSAPLMLRLRDSAGAPSTLLLTIDDGGPALQAIGGVSLTADRLEVSGTVNARMIFDEALAIQATEIASLDVGVKGASFAGVDADGTLKLRGLERRADTWDGTLALELTGRGGIGDRILIADTDLQLQGPFRLAGETFSLSPTGGTLRLGETVLAEQLRLTGPTELTLATGAEQSITLDLESGVGRHRLEFAPFALEGTLRRPDEEEIALNLTAARLRLNGALPGAETVTIEGASLRQSAYPVALSGAEVEIILHNGDAAFDLAADVAHEAEPAFITPARLKMQGRLAGEAVKFTSTLTQAAHAFTLSIEGDYDVAQDFGGAAFTIAPLTFSPDGPQPGDLFPIAAGRLKAVAGTLGAEGQLSWAAGQPDILLRLGLDGLGFTAEDAEISALTGQVTIDGIGPLTTPAGQHITGQVAAAGLAPMPFDLAFHLQSNGHVGIERAEAGFAGGQLATRDAWIDPDRRDGMIELDVGAIELAELMRLADLDGVSGEGRLTGTLPIEIKAGAVAIAGGALASEGAGILRLSGAGLEELLGKRDDTVGLMVQALADFHFDALDIAIDKALEGEGAVRMKLSGANPAVLEGHPFVFNVDLTSDFDRLMRVVREGMGTADDVLQWGIEGAAR